MYGVPADLDLSFLHGAELIQVCLGVYDVQFHFHPAGHIAVADGWEVFDEAGTLLDHGSQEAPRPPFQLHRLLGQRVSGTKITSPTFLELTFERGDRLRLIDNYDSYESFTIDPGDARGEIVV